MPPSNWDWKGSKIFSINCGLMPGPVSAKLTCQSSPEDSTETVRVPFVAHGADRILAEIPEDLLDFVAVGERPGFGQLKLSLDQDRAVLRGQAMFQQGKSVFEQW